MGSTSAPPRAAGGQLRRAAGRRFLGRARQGPRRPRWRAAWLAALVAGAPLLAPPLSGGSLEITPEAARSGRLGLEIALGRCAGADDVTIASPPRLSGSFEACTSLRLGAVEVDAGGASFTAGQSISLGEGFSVAAEASADFTIDPTLFRYAFLEDASPASEVRYRVSFWMNLDELELRDGETLDLLAGYSQSGELQFRSTLKLNPTLSENRLVLAARQDDGSLLETPFGEEVPVPAGWAFVELDWSAGHGHFVVSLDGVEFGFLSELDNDTGRIDRVRWGFLGGSLVATTGRVLFDDFYSAR